METTASLAIRYALAGLLVVFGTCVCCVGICEAIKKYIFSPRIKCKTEFFLGLVGAIIIVFGIGFFLNTYHI